MEELQSYTPIGVLMANLDTGEAAVVWACNLKEFEPLLAYDIMSDILFDTEVEFHATKDRYKKDFDLRQPYEKLEKK